VAPVVAAAAVLVVVVPDTAFVVVPEVPFEEPHEASSKAHAAKQLRNNHELFLVTFCLLLITGMKTDC